MYWLKVFECIYYWGSILSGILQEPPPLPLKLDLCWHININSTFMPKLLSVNFSKNIKINKNKKRRRRRNIILATMLHLCWYVNINPTWVAVAVLPVIFQKGGLHSNKYFQILSINTILTIMKIFGVCMNRTSEH